MSFGRRIFCFVRYLRSVTMYSLREGANLSWMHLMGKSLILILTCEDATDTR
jgi:hypothetical protein